jgi:hypothetical protein
MAIVNSFAKGYSVNISDFLNSVLDIIELVWFLLEIESLIHERKKR